MGGEAEKSQTDVACGMANLIWNRKLSDSDSVLLQLDLAGGGVESERLQPFRLKHNYHHAPNLHTRNLHLCGRRDGCGQAAQRTLSSSGVFGRRPGLKFYRAGRPRRRGMLYYYKTQIT